ncbi:MAG: peptide deformylase [Bacteroidales bacterium]|nr:peptide deformylase [Bacteroidales bacterium]
MIKPIYLYGSDVLRRKAEDVDLTATDEIATLVQDLKDTLQASEGVGLAAPQIGVSKRVVIVDGRDLVETYPYLKDFYRVIINPRLVSESEKMCEYSEGCLSVPGIFADVMRPDSIRLEYYDENLNKVTEDFDNFACRMVQHEMSHLDGSLFVDLVSPIRKKILTKKLQNISRGKVSTSYKATIKK